MKAGQDVFLPLPIQTLPTFWVTRILILRSIIFYVVLDSTFQDCQVPGFPEIWLGPGQAWAGSASHPEVSSSASQVDHLIVCRV